MTRAGALSQTDRIRVSRRWAQELLLLLLFLSFFLFRVPQASQLSNQG